MISDSRVSAFRRKLAGEEVGTFVVTDVSNVRYLTGIHGVFDDDSNVALLITDEITRIYTDFRYEEAASIAAEGTPWVVYSPEESLYITMCENLETLGIEDLALEASMPYGRFRFISEQFKGRVRVVDQWVESLRQVKEAVEIERIAAATAVTEATLDHIFGLIKPGVTEAEIALEIEVFMRTNGAEGVAFPPIVASGMNTSKPHAGVTDKELEVGDFVTIDLGARVDGYCSDMTRTVVLGTATTRQREIYSTVLDASSAALAAIRAGVPGLDLDAVARDLIAERSFGSRFGHGLGHGVGLDVHEMPNLGKRWRDSILAGSVVTVEPGVYIPEFGGVRIEDLVVVEEAGCRLLTTRTRELVEL